MNANQCKEKVAEIARKLHQRQMVNTNEGNVSIRSGDLVYVTPSQTCKENLLPEVVAVCDLEGNQISGPIPISSETGMHLHIYKLREDVKAVVHNHSPFATAYAINRLPIQTDCYTEMILLYDKIPVVPYGAPGTPAISAGIGDYIHQTDVFLLANHGLVAVGVDADRAFEKAESAESLAKTLLLAKLLGGGHPLSQEELKEIYRMRKESLGKDPISL